MSGRLLIAAPLSVEAALVGSGARRFTGRFAGRFASGSAADRGSAGAVVSVHKTGMGPERAKTAAATLANAPGAALLVLGFCGGLDEQSVPGEVIVAEAVLAAPDEGHAPERVTCTGPDGLAAALRGTGMAVRSGEIVCVSKLALGPRRAQLLASGALAVDMESVWLAAGAAGRPFAVVRVVLDSPNHELLRPGAVAGALRAARALRRAAATLRDWAPAGAPPRDAGPAAAGERELGPRRASRGPQAG